MGEPTESASITVEGEHLRWEEQCLVALSGPPFKFVAADEGAKGGREFVASCSPVMGPFGFVHVGVEAQDSDSTSLHLTAVVVADNPLREFLRPGAKVIMKRLKRALGVP